METKYLLKAIKDAAFEVRLNLAPGYLILLLPVLIMVI